MVVDSGPLTAAAVPFRGGGLEWLFSAMLPRFLMASSLGRISHQSLALGSCGFRRQGRTLHGAGLAEQPDSLSLWASSTP